MRNEAQQLFIRGAIGRWCANPYAQPAVAYTVNAFTRGTRLYAHVYQAVQSPELVPVWHTRLPGTRQKAGEPSRMITAWMMMHAQSGERSMPAIAGISRRKGRNTGSHSELSTDCRGE